VLDRSARLLAERGAATELAAALAALEAAAAEDEVLRALHPPQTLS
jgi:hypothetical protein